MNDQHSPSAADPLVVLAAAGITFEVLHEGPGRACPGCETMEPLAA